MRLEGVIEGYLNPIEVFRSGLRLGGIMALYETIYVIRSGIEVGVTLLLVHLQRCQYHNCLQHYFRWDGVITITMASHHISFHIGFVDWVLIKAKWPLYFEVCIRRVLYHDQTSFKIWSQYHVLAIMARQYMLCQYL